MKNAEIIAKAQHVLGLAKRTGFKLAEITLLDDDDNAFGKVEDYAFSSEGGESNLRVLIMLTTLCVDISRDPEDDTGDPIITYPN